jgi:hypothetical protein
VFISEFERRANVTVSNKMRWLAGATGCLTAVTGSLDAGLGFAVVPGFLIVGAAVAGRFPRIGRDLIWFGAVVLSLCVLPIGVGILLLSLRGGSDLWVTSSSAASVLLVVWCDVTLVMEAVKTRRTRHAGETSSYDSADIKGILLLVLFLFVSSLFAFGVRHERKKRAQKRREVAYQSALRSYAQVLKPGMTRKEVEDYLRANKVEFRQTCCVDMKEYKKGSWDDVVKIGEEDAPWFCNFTAVYVGFQFTGHGQFDGMWRADDFDKLRAVTLYRMYDKCL